MGMANRRGLPALLMAGLLALGVLALSIDPAAAQNRRKSYEIFIYFGQYGGQTVPSVIQSGVVQTYRLDPALSQYTLVDPNGNPACTICKNLGDTGPNSIFLGPLNTNNRYTPVDVCFVPNGPILPVAYDPNSIFLDECDNDIEARYEYNAQGIVTNGEVQRNDGEFVLGARLGYNITNHWEVEVDLGFAKQRLDMTRNLIPLLSERVSNPADPFFAQSAQFFDFTWANVDFLALGYDPILNANGTVASVGGVQEIPNVPHRRSSNNPGAAIPAVLPMPLVDSERFADVTDFVNRVLKDPTAFRNRANQINIDIFSVGLSGVYNFNTKPDSRVIPYLTAGFGKWMRQFDTPYEGEDSDYISYGGGIRFFVNEIFAFRAEMRGMSFRQDDTTITAKLPKQNLRDIRAIVAGRNVPAISANSPGCFRDQDPPQQNPPVECTISYINAFNALTINGGPPYDRIPNGANPGGFADVEFVTELDDFWEARIGFDVLLGGR